MTRRSTHAAAAALLAACCCALPLRAAAPGEEQRLIGVLRSGRPPAEKDAACKRLKQVGTAKAVPDLARLLTDKELSHVARYALESMPCAEAGQALRDALAKTAGRTKAGIIDSLGDRAEREAAPALAKLLADPDAMVASAAATALGKIGGPGALGALTAAMQAPRGSARPAVLDGLLLCADRLRGQGQAQQASAVYRKLYDAKLPEHVRTAAYRGLVLAAGDDAARLVMVALAGTDRAGRLAALPLVREIEGPEATKAFAAILPRLPAPTQAALLESLAQRGDTAAVPAALAAAGSSQPAVRVAAVHALAVLGDASAVPTLARAAASEHPAEQKAARRALARLRRGNVRQALLDHLRTARPAEQVELARALGARRESAAVPALLKLAEGEVASSRVASLRALALLADETVADRLVRLLVREPTQAVRDQIGTALVAIAGRSKRREALARSILAAMKGASVLARCALLHVAGRIGGADALGALRAGLRDESPAVREAAVRTMASFAGAAAAPDLLALARTAPQANHRVLALRGYWRVVGLAGDRSAAARLAMCEAGLAAARRPEEKRLGLAELAKVPHRGALKLAEALCKDQAVRAEAEAACVRLAAALASSSPAEAKAALRRVLAGSRSPQVRADARKALDAMQQYVGYITAWAVAGPYRQQGKQCEQLFDVAFAPEQPAAKAAWKPAAPPADPALAWQVDLGGVVGGDHCVVYVKTRVFAPKAGRVRLDIGTDDGIKLWVNGKLVHANNAIRGLTPGQDRAHADLRQGWNDFLVKITQHTLGCGACIRIRDPNGGGIEGLRFDPAGR